METLRLVLPEWQGCGVNADVHRGATALAAALFDGRAFTTVDAPVEETLHSSDGVLGLHSIAPRFTHTLDVIRRAAPERIVTIGGTCGVELAPIAYLNERHDGDLAVLWLDAHADLNTPASSPSGHFHGMALRTLLGDGPDACVKSIGLPLLTGQIFLVGARDLDPPEQEFVSEHSVPALTDQAFREPRILIDLLLARNFGRLYVHFDVDVLDPEGFPASLMRAPGGGPSLEEAVALIQTLATEFDVAGLSVLEFCDRGDGWTERLSQALRGLVA